ncbi:nagb/rpia/CoA transferase-like protein [Annulohypoxylon maeteangense]|uniref:nagb/rpia/CoA transferase-like protein n=1 Tax=Annulohypoxylon maeteangense TaxID=1927788 RepID=UPI00200879C5|nr:nagb/rpia/CoA transferase-like protein [Annulohypoxylon maeteangense]KAI0881047.1 nagb/rpia/CoA transferase-like protein [Annulohypoxylon maeteangense]
MSTTQDRSPPEADSQQAGKNDKVQPQPTKESKEKNVKSEAAEASKPSKLSGAELKAKAKAEKAARRAQVKVSKEVAKGEAAVSSSPGPLGPSAGEIKGGKSKGKQDGAATTPAAGKQAVSKGPASVVPIEPKFTIPECFSHLSMAKRIPITQADKDVHPTVLALGQQMATFTIDESITRLKATLLAFKKVIDSYTTPPGNTLARHLTPHVLNPQIEYLTACRPMCFSMGNAIRWLKLQVSKIDPDVPELEAKKQLCSSIDTFIQERISMADLVITEKATEKIQNGDVILTFGWSSIIERTLVQAHRFAERKFSVVILDDPYEKKGQTLAKNLAASEIKVSYYGDFGGLRCHLPSVNKIFVSAESMFNNGSMYARSGTCDLAIAAKQLDIPVLVLCESINITERVSTDSLTYNEIDPERSSSASFRLLYDTTPDKYLSLVISELGTVQPTSVPDLLRKLEESN